MYEEIAQLLVKNIRFYLDQSYQSKGYGGSPTKMGLGNKRATSSLYNNIETEIEYDQDGFPESFVVYMEDYWYWVDRGRKPGGFPPIDDIISWINNKPVSWTPTDGKIPSIKQRAFLIGRSIAEKGTNKTDFTRLATDKTLNDALDMFEEEYADQIEDFIYSRVFAGLNQRDLLL